MSISTRQSVTATGPDGESSIVALNLRVPTFQVSLVVTPGGAATPTVQYTVDDIWANGYDPSTGNWINHSEATTVSAETDTNLFFPCSAVRVINDSGAGSTDASTLVVYQTGGV